MNTTPTLVATVCTLALVSATGLPAQQLGADPSDRVVAIGDIHGDFEAFVSILQTAGLVNDRNRWIGGAATLVQTGDFTDRGSEVRAVMDLLMSLEAQAESAGGRVEVLLGNHEVMNLMRDVRDVNPQVYASFIDGESEARRKTAFRAYRRLRMSRLSASITASDLQQQEDDWMAAHPPGFLEYQEALGLRGHYGRWLRAKPVAIQLDDTIFLHAGISPELADLSLEDINERVWRELEAFDAYQRELVARKLTLPFFTFEEILMTVQTVLYPPGAQPPAVLERVLSIGGWFTVHPGGPLWFRGYATWPDDEGTAHIVRLLDRYEAARFVVGHTVPTTKRITSRLEDKVFLIDTGMLASHYRGRASALEIHGEQLIAIYAETRMASWEPAVASTVDFPAVSLSSRREVGPEGIVDRVDPRKDSQAVSPCS